MTEHLSAPRWRPRASGHCSRLNRIFHNRKNSCACFLYNCGYIESSERAKREHTCLVADHLSRHNRCNGRADFSFCHFCLFLYTQYKHHFVPRNANGRPEPLYRPCWNDSVPCAAFVSSCISMASLRYFSAFASFLAVPSPRAYIWLRLAHAYMFFSSHAL